MTDTTDTETGVAHENCLQIVESLHMSDESAQELAKGLNEPLGLVEDRSYDRCYLIVRWPDDDE